MGRKAVHLTTLRDRLQGDLNKKQAEVQELHDQVEKLTKVGELFRKLMDIMVDKQVRAVENIVTEGFHSIFHDQDLYLEADVGPKYNKICVEFFLRRGPKESPLSHRGKPLDSFGGGPSSLASLILRLLAVVRLNRFPVLFLDEALAAVSVDYVDHTGLFLTSLAKRMGVDILLVTHQQGFVEHSSTAYRCTEESGKDGSTSLALRRQK